MDWIARNAQISGGSSVAANSAAQRPNDPITANIRVVTKNPMSICSSIWREKPVPAREIGNLNWDFGLNV